MPNTINQCVAYLAALSADNNTFEFLRKHKWNKKRKKACVEEALTAYFDGNNP